MMLFDRAPSRARVRRLLGARGASFVLAVGLSGCAPPLQSGGVTVMSGADERLGILCRWRRGDEARKDLCGAGEEAVAPARVRQIAVGESPLGGPLAAGRAGDYLLENAEVAVVIDQLGRGTGFAESGGNLIDAADARVRRDELGQMFAVFGGAARQALYDRIESGVEGDGTAWVEVSGRELRNEQLKVTTRYSLRPLDRGVLIATSIENRGAAPAGLVDLGDEVQWGAAEAFAPGKEVGFRGDFTGMFVAGVGRSVGYLIAPVKDIDLSAKTGASSSHVVLERDVALGSGARVRYERALAIAPRGDPVAVATEFFFMQGGAPGGLEVKLVDGRGAPVTPPGGGRVLLERAGGAGGDTPSGGSGWWMRAGGEVGVAGGPLVIGGEAPPGRYTVRFEGGGRMSLGEAAVVIKPGAATPVTLVVSDAGRLHVAVREVELEPGAGVQAVRESGGVKGASRPSPAKITVLDATSGGRAVAPMFVKDGEAEIAIAPGRYRVIASRGPEFSLAEATLEVLAGKTADASMSISRVVDTRGYIACDLHQRSSRSVDSSVSMEGRALANAALGIECAVASERNAVVDPAPAVRAAGLSAEVAVFTGVELASDVSRTPFGHVVAFPLLPTSADSRGGAVPVRDRSPGDVLADLRALPGERVVLIPHPRSGATGYFDQGAADPASTGAAAATTSSGFDAVEVWSGRDVQARARVMADLWKLLQGSRPVTPVAGSDARGLAAEEDGYPRTYVAVPSDEPARLSAAELVEGLRVKRDVVLTNGPFMTMQAGGARQGGVVTAPGGGKGPRRVDLTIHVERAPWVDASELVLWVGGVPGEPIALSGAQRTPRGAIVDEISVPVVVGPGKAPARGKRPAAIHVSEDSFIVAVVRGTRPLGPIASGDPAESAPFAMTAPLWIDVDGDGRALGR